MLTPEKLQQLDELSVKLLDVYLEEADPENWVNEETAKAEAAQMVKDGESVKGAAKVAANWKGERYWEKKNANQTMAMLLNLQRLQSDAGQGAGVDEEGAGKQVKKEVAKLEKVVKKRLARTRPNLKVVGK